MHAALTINGLSAGFVLRLGQPPVCFRAAGVKQVEAQGERQISFRDGDEKRLEGGARRVEGAGSDRAPKRWLIHPVHFRWVPARCQAWWPQSPESRAELCFPGAGGVLTRDGEAGYVQALYVGAGPEAKIGVRGVCAPGFLRNWEPVAGPGRAGFLPGLVKEEPVHGANTGSRGGRTGETQTW